MWRRIEATNYVGKSYAGHGGKAWRVKKEPSTAFAGRLSRLREDRGITQRKLGEVIHVNNSTISRYEAGTDEPAYDTLVIIARYFGVDPNYLLGWTPTAHKELTEKRFLELLEAHGKMMYKEMMK